MDHLLDFLSTLYGEVLRIIFTKWLGSGYGLMKALMSDNGGEFSSDEMREVASFLGVRLITTGAEAPWMNGIVERNHAVMDNILIWCFKLPVCVR